MEQEQLLKTNFFTTEEWDSTPQGVKNFVVQQKQRIEELEKQLENLQEKAEGATTRLKVFNRKLYKPLDFRKISLM